MIIYNPHNTIILELRIKEAEELLAQIPAQYCFITGSFLYKENYKDIDIFVVSRTKKEIKINNPKVKVILIDFNDLYSLFYHSVSKSCIAKNILPVRPLKVTISDYWQVINEAVPTLLNSKDTFHKEVRFLILYTEYFKSGEILDTFQLDAKIKELKDYKAVLAYIQENIPLIMQEKLAASYLKRFFYTQAGYYKKIEYAAQQFLYELTHLITRGATIG